MSSFPYDVIIAGGGPAGLAMAIAISGPANRMPLSTLVIDRGNLQQRSNARGDCRASAITASSRLMLAAMGVWPALADKAEPIREITVTDSRLEAQSRPLLLGFDEGLLQDRPSAYMVENADLYQALYAQAKTSDMITIADGRTIAACHWQEGGAETTDSSGQAHKAALMIAADGARSSLRRLGGIDTFGWSYAQSALILTVAVEKDHHGRAEEHFLPAGPFAILPLKGKRVSLVWTETHDKAAELAAACPVRFLEELKQRFGDHLGKIEPVGEVQVYPLSLLLAKRFIGKRLALIGDAAHVIHPLAGLGFNLGLRDIAALAETLFEAMLIGQDIGNLAVLKRYEEWRRFDTLSTGIMTDFLNRLFSNDNKGLRSLRDLGLSTVDNLPGVKSGFMAAAAGFANNMPKLLTGERL